MNTGYIKIVFLLLSLVVYGNNKALATEPESVANPLRRFARRNNARKNAILIKNAPPYIFSAAIYEQNKRRLCTDYSETIQANDLMGKAVAHLLYYANIREPYTLYREYDSGATLYSMRAQDDSSIDKLHLKVSHPNKYHEIINTLWSSNICKDSEKIVRVYDPNLVMVQHRIKNDIRSFQGYFYALSAKAEISRDTTIIVYASANINDHNSLNQNPCTNTILKEANSFKTDINSEMDIRNGELSKLFVNLSGYLIKKNSDHIDLIYINSMRITDPNDPPFITYAINIAKHAMLIKLRDKISEE
ncbi:fam-a protein [Plasmodium vinckei vinckei]|uniref:Fam-a protein n=1 Tax=Plasmodium vinckei vinckei TaxID=54757 RepID=A0A449BQZ0_PLAVN|nr:fam-a protein [Plasmodium vinckei vinckei]VEV55842.1 fam-a protein [Plasmodium vinckei vinckei]